MKQPRIDFPSTSALVRLRVFLEDAERRAADFSEPGRHLAIVALDGAVEYALWLVGHATNADLPTKADFHRTIDFVARRLKELGREWEPAALGPTRQLHTARNAAQHEAISHDPRQLSDWAQAARAFIDSLVAAAFEVNVAQILLADSIGHPGCRSLLRHAEEALAGEDHEGSFRAAWAAFELAREEWRERHRASLPAPAPAVGQLWPRGGGPAHDPRVEPIGELLEVASFATDVGEYVTLRAAYDQHVSGWPPEREDAMRAISFAASWISRWEVFSRGYPAERFASHWEQMEPPVFGDREMPEPISCKTVVATSSTGDDLYVVNAEIANVPERGRGEWGADIVQVWHDAVRDTGTRVRTIAVNSEFRAGRLTLVLEPGCAGEDLAAALRRAVALADERFRRRIAERAQTERRRGRLADALREAIKADPGGLLDAEVHSAVRGTGERMIASIAIADAAEHELALGAEVLRGLGGPLAGAGLYEGRIEIDLSDSSAEAIAAHRDAASSLRRKIKRSRDERAARARGHHAFEATLADAFPASSDSAR